MIEYQNRVVIVTGSTGGLGRELCMEFARQGAKLVLAGRSLPQLEAFAKELTQLGTTCIWQYLDLTNFGTIPELVHAAQQRFGKIHVLVNNAGDCTYSRYFNLPWEQIERETLVNYLGPVRLIQEVLPSIKQSGGGQIINICSLLGFRPFPFCGSYSAAKAALANYGDALRMELQEHNIDVINAYLGKVATGFSVSKTARRDIVNRELIGAGMAPSKAAKLIIHGARHRRSQVQTHLVGTPIRWAQAIAAPLLDRLIYKYKIKA